MGPGLMFGSYCNCAHVVFMAREKTIMSRDEGESSALGVAQSCVSGEAE